jgi:hypothetical protein
MRKLRRIRWARSVTIIAFLGFAPLILSVAILGVAGVSSLLGVGDSALVILIPGCVLGAAYMISYAVCVCSACPRCGKAPFRRWPSFWSAKCGNCGLRLDATSIEEDATSIEEVDSDSVDESPVCSNCGYSLRGIEPIRCPECGCVVGFNKTFEQLGVSASELRDAAAKRRRNSASDRPSEQR